MLNIKSFFTCAFFAVFFYTEFVVERVTAPYFYGSILLRALKSKIIVLLTYI
jgi:hypothetical protein